MALHEIPVAVASALREILRPLERAFATSDDADRLLLDHGWRPPADEQYVESFRERFSFGERVQALDDLVGSLRGQGDASATEIAEALDTAIELVADLRRLATGEPPPELAELLDAPAFWSEFPHDLYGSLLADYLRRRRPGLFVVLHLTGVIRFVPILANDDERRVDFERVVVEWSRLAGIFRGPRDVLAREFGWGTDSFQHAELLGRLDRSLGVWPVVAGRAPPIDGALDVYYGVESGFRADVDELRVLLAADHEIDGRAFEVGLTVLPVPPGDEPDGPPLGIAIGPYVLGEAETTISLGGPLRLELSGEFASDRPFAVELRPGEIAARADESLTEVEARIAVKAEPRNPWVLLGARDAARVEVDGLVLAFEARGAVRDPDLLLSLGTTALRVVLPPEDLDGFLRGALDGGGEVASGEVFVTWSSATGLGLSGRGAFAIDLPINRSVGPMRIHTLGLSIEAQGEGVEAGVTVSGSLRLGPLALSVDDIGMRVAATPVEDDSSDATLANLAIDLGFAPPKGVGARLGSGPIRGGGFLRVDGAQYAGALELEAFGVAVKGLGLIDARDDAEATSAIISVTNELPPVPLGLGFSLTGVGGLVAVHRRIDVDALRGQLRGGGLDHVLFAPDPVADAPQLLRDLSTSFPRAEGRHVIGPMARVEWGRGGLLEAEIAVLLELPSPARLVLLGTVAVSLPHRDAAIVALNVDILGELDVARRRLNLDGTLRDSRVGPLPVRGDFALRIGWGEDALFGLAIGGFHPAFEPPPGFPALQRVTVPLGVDDNPRITLQGYFAVTSNTAQIGALAELRAKAGFFSIVGMVSFDALFVFSPFSFTADFSARVALMRKQRVLAGIRLRATLSGPTPWRAVGKACLEIRFLPDICVGFDARFGKEKRAGMPPADAWLTLRDAISSPQSWSRPAPRGRYRPVTLIPNAPAELVDPGAGAELQQDEVPLNRRIERLGGAELVGGALRFEVVQVRVAGEPTPFDVVEGLFAPGLFAALTDDEKLRADSFEPMVAGIGLGADDIAHGPGETAEIEAETIVIDSARRLRRRIVYHPPALASVATTRRGSAADSPLQEGKLRPVVPAVSFNAETFVIIDANTREPRLDLVPPTTLGAAREALAAHRVSRAERDASLTVVSADDLEVVR